MPGEPIDDSSFEADPPRQAVALPRWANTPGKVFCLAGLLKILVIMFGAVPWAGFTTPTGLQAAVTMIPFGLVLVVLARAVLDRGLVRRWWLTPALLLGSAAFIYAQRQLYPPRRVVRTPDAALVAAQAERREHAAARLKQLPTAQDADRMWDLYEQGKAAAQERGGSNQP